MTSITLAAPAKVNLFLKILNKRADGYHSILTLFERISLADVITISAISKGIKVSSDKFITADPRDNLVYKAAELILKYIMVNKRSKGIDRGVRIRMKKLIPIAAGLGGGSSDAASVLMGMNKMFKLGISRTGLMRIAARLGSDVPFFVSDTPFAVGKGRGDILVRAHIKAPLWHLIVYPGFRLATRDTYEAFDHNLKIRTRDLTHRHGSGPSPELLSKDLTEAGCDAKIRRCLTPSMDFCDLEPMLHNDLQDIAVAKNKNIGKVLQRLASSLGKRVIVSGSGPSVFCLYPTGKEAMRARRMLLKSVPPREMKGWQIFVSRTQI